MRQGYNFLDEVVQQISFFFLPFFLKKRINKEFKIICPLEINLVIEQKKFSMGKKKREKKRKLLGFGFFF